MVSNTNGGDRSDGVSRRRFVRAAIGGVGVGAIGQPRPLVHAQADDEPTGVDVPDGRPVSPRHVTDENYAHLYAYRKRRALEGLLSDPSVNDAVAEMIASFEAYEPRTNRLEAVSVQGGSDVEIEGGLDEGGFRVTVPDLRVAYGLIDRETDTLVAVTLTDPEAVEWTVTDDEYDEARLRRVLEEPQVQTYVEGNDWYPAVALPDTIVALESIDRGGAVPVVLAVATDDGVVAVLALHDVRDDAVGDVLDVRATDRFAAAPHELASEVAPADETAVDAVRGVPIEQRPWETADDGGPRIEAPDESFEGASWAIDWESTATHGIAIAASYRYSPVARLEAPASYVAYGLPERDGESTLEWYVPDGDFAGELLLQDVHSADVGGHGPLGVVEYPETSAHPEGVRFRTQFHTGPVDPEAVDHHAGYRFGQSNYELAYDFWADGTYTLGWERRGPDFAAAYGPSGVAVEGTAGEDEDEAETPQIQTETADTIDDRGRHHCIAAFAVDITPGTDRDVEIRHFDGDEWTPIETESYLIGEPGAAVRFTNPDGPETVDLSLENGTEVVVASSGPREVPTQDRLETEAVETGFVHPAQYIGDESVRDERVIVWVLLEAAPGEVPLPPGSTSAVAHASLSVSGY